MRKRFEWPPPPPALPELSAPNLVPPRCDPMLATPMFSRAPISLGCGGADDMVASRHSAEWPSEIYADYNGHEERSSGCGAPSVLSRNRDCIEVATRGQAHTTASEVDNNSHLNAVSPCWEELPSCASHWADAWQDPLAQSQWMQAHGAPRDDVESAVTARNLSQARLRQCSTRLAALLAESEHAAVWAQATALEARSLGGDLCFATRAAPSRSEEKRRSSSHELELGCGLSSLHGLDLELRHLRSEVEGLRHLLARRGARGVWPAVTAARPPAASSASLLSTLLLPPPSPWRSDLR